MSNPEAEAETEAEATKTDLYKTDCYELLAHMNRHDKELIYKRRWLLGLTGSKSEQEQSSELKFLEDRSLPESLLRKDDLFYETIKSRVKEAYRDGVEGKQHITQDNHVVHLPNISQVLATLDNMTNKGLYHVAMVLTDGSDSFENTCPRMKKFIKESLAKISKNQYLKISGQLSQILSNSQYFKQNCATNITWTILTRGAAVEIINHLEDLPTQTLMAMRRKLRGVGGGIPQTHCPKGNGKHSRVVKQVRETCEKMLLVIDQDEKIQELLAKAMSVAVLSRKIEQGFYDPNATDFHHFSPEIINLHNEIAKAIWLMKDKVDHTELRDLHHRLDPDAKFPNKGLRTAVKKLLTEYLFDCDDMGTIPKSLYETLAIINQTSRTVPYRLFPKENIEEEVECILNVSAQTKQVVLDMLPNIEYDQDFADAYMEDLEESEDGDCDDDDDAYLQQLLLKNSQNHSSQSDDSQLEYVGESNGITSKPLCFATDGNDSSSHLTLSKSVDCGFAPPSKAPFVGGVEFVDRATHRPFSLFQESELLTVTQNTDDKQYVAENNGEDGIVGISKDGIFSLHSASERRNGNNVNREESERDVILDSTNTPDPLVFCEQEKFVDGEHSTKKNKYLAIQEVSDETTMDTYDFIGCMLKEFARIEGKKLDTADEMYLKGNSSVSEHTQAEKEKGDSSMEDVDGSFLVRLVEEQIPSFPQSAKEGLAKLLSLI